MISAEIKNERMINVSICVDSALCLAADIAKIIDVPYDYYWNVGEKRDKSRNYLNNFSRWGIECNANSVEGVDIALDELFDRISNIVYSVSRLPLDCRISVNFSIDENNSVFGFGIDKRHVRLAAAIGAEIDMSFRVRVEG